MRFCATWACERSRHGACALTISILHEIVTVVGKGRGEGKERKIPVDDPIIARWQAHIRRHGIRRDGYMLFTEAHTLWADRTRTTNGSRTRVDRTPPTSPFFASCERSANSLETALPPELVPHFPLTPKVMRRTFACTQLILHALGLGGMDVRTLQKAMGHDRLDTTQKYMADVEDYINASKRHVNTRDGVRAIVELRRKLEFEP